MWQLNEFKCFCSAKLTQLVSTPHVIYSQFQVRDIKRNPHKHIEPPRKFESTSWDRDARLSSIRSIRCIGDLPFQACIMLYNPKSNKCHVMLVILHLFSWTISRSCSHSTCRWRSDSPLTHSTVSNKTSNTNKRRAGRKVLDRLIFDMNWRKQSIQLWTQASTGIECLTDTTRV